MHAWFVVCMAPTDQDRNSMSRGDKISHMPAWGTHPSAMRTDTLVADAGCCRCICPLSWAKLNPGSLALAAVLDSEDYILLEMVAAAGRE